jgi:adenylate kinase
MQTVIISGPPGSGKGTQAKLLANYLGFIHVSTGEILRKEIAGGTQLGKIAQARIDDGNFVSDEVANEMIINFINKNKSISGMVLDGFPRTEAQCVEFDRLKNNLGIDSNVCISIDVNQDELVKRLLQRNKLAGRPDDSNVEIIEHRLKLYRDCTRPVTDYYLRKGLCEIIDGHNSVDSVFQKIKTAVPKFIEI